MKLVVCILNLLCTALLTRALAETDTEALARAEKTMQSAADRAQADPTHPAFHVASPAQWMNDPNGPIFYRGWYHLFYQLTPDSDRSGIKYWGHVRSRDLAAWEHLPIAIAPSGDRGEESIWSGCCTLDGAGHPMIFYTSIGQGKSPFDQAAQWAATGDDDLINWKKSPANPVLADAVNGGKKIYDWRDPFVFQDGKKFFLVLGGHLEKNGHAAVNLYEAEDSALTKWKYRGPLFELPDAPTVECPNFFKLGKEWVLFISPYGKVQYFVGRFDAATGRFTPRTNGILDPGNFYAPNTMLVPDGRRVVWGWVNGFPDGHGWNGCLTLPRQLILARDGQLLQEPAPQLQKLRGKKTAWPDVKLAGDGEALPLPKTNTLEIEATVELKPAEKVALEFQNADTGGKIFSVSFDGEQLCVEDNRAPLHLPPGTPLKLRVFLDRSVVEVFANGRASITKTIAPLPADLSLKIRASGEGTVAKSVAVWPLQGIWRTSSR
jgi:beta-fructofuranosidase